MSDGLFLSKSKKLIQVGYNILLLAPIVQWIERGTSNPLMQVRFLLGAPKLIANN